METYQSDDWIDQLERFINATQILWNKVPTLKNCHSYLCEIRTYKDKKKIKKITLTYYPTSGKFNYNGVAFHRLVNIHEVIELIQYGLGWKEGEGRQEPDNIPDHSPPEYPHTPLPTEMPHDQEKNEVEKKKAQDAKHKAEQEKRDAESADKDEGKTTPKKTKQPTNTQQTPRQTKQNKPPDRHGIRPDKRESYTQIRHKT